MEEILGPIIFILVFALPGILRYLARRQREQERQQPQQPQEREQQQQQQQRQRPYQRETADPFEELRRRIEQATKRRQHEETSAEQRGGAPPRPQPQQRPQAQPQPRPQPQVRREPRPEPRQQPQRRPEREPQPARYEQPSYQRPSYERPEYAKRERTRQHPAGEPAYQPTAPGSLAASLSVETRSARVPTSSAWQRIENLPTMQKAIMLSEVLGKPRSLRDPFAE